MRPGAFFEDLDSRIHAAMTPILAALPGTFEGRRERDLVHGAHHAQQAQARLFAQAWESFADEEGHPPPVTLPAWPALAEGAGPAAFRSWLALAGIFLAGAAGGLLQHGGEAGPSQGEIDEWHGYAAGKIPRAPGKDAG